MPHVDRNNPHAAFSQATQESMYQFGTHQITKTMTDDVAWTWTNSWGGRVFTTTLGHPDTFANPNYARLFVNGIHWAAGQSVPPVNTKIRAIRTGKPAKQVANRPESPRPKNTRQVDAKNTTTGKSEPLRDPELEKYGIYEQTARRAASVEPASTALPLELKKGDRIALIGNTLLERLQHFGHLEALLQQAYPHHNSSM